MRQPGRQDGGEYKPKTEGERSDPSYTSVMDAARTLTAAVAKDSEWCVVRCLEIEVASQGETVDQGLANLREALELYFEDGEVPASFEHPLVTSIEIRVLA